MKQLHVFEVLFLDIFQELLKDDYYLVSSNGVCEHSGKDWEKLHLLGLIIEEGCFLFLAADVFELSSDG